MTFWPLGLGATSVMTRHRSSAGSIHGCCGEHSTLMKVDCLHPLPPSATRLLPPSLLELLSTSCRSVTWHQNQVTRAQASPSTVQKRAQCGTNPQHSRLSRERQQVTVAGWQRRHSPPPPPPLLPPPPQSHVEAPAWWKVNFLINQWATFISDQVTETQTRGP